MKTKPSKKAEPGNTGRVVGLQKSFYGSVDRSEGGGHVKALRACYGAEDRSEVRRILTEHHLIVRG